MENTTTEVPASYAGDEGAFFNQEMFLLRPSICGLGFLTNLLSLLVFLQPSMRSLSCSVYLATKAVSDFLFLLTVFIVWLVSIHVDFFNMQGVCQLVIFASYLTAFVSIWLVVALTIENLLRVVKPWFAQRSCTARAAAVVTTMIVALGVALYHFALWNNGIRRQNYFEYVPGVLPGQANATAESPYSSDVSVSQAAHGRVEEGKELVLLQKLVNQTRTSSHSISPSAPTTKNSEDPTLVSSSTILITAGAYIADNVLDSAASRAATDLPASSLTTVSTADLYTSYPPADQQNMTEVLREGPLVCRDIEEFHHIAVAMTYLDSLLTLLVPMVILAVLNSVIIVLALRSTRRQQKRDLQKNMSRYGSQYHQPSGESVDTSCAKSNHQQSNGKNNSPQAKRTSTADPAAGSEGRKKRRSTAASLETQASRFLFSVSMTLLLFHLPSHIVRLKYLLGLATPLDISLFKVFETLYHAHYAVGFFVYFIFGANFRRVFLKLIGK